MYTLPWEFVDNGLLFYLNVALGNPTMDQFWLVITHLERQEMFVYLALSMSLVLLTIYRLQFIKVEVAVVLAVGITDLVASRGIKSWVNRPRPFQNSELSPWLRQVGDANGPSFPSNHAANCFAGAAIMAYYFRRSRYFFYAFAGLVAWSRVALGVHYPSDVIAGAILGIVVGFLVRATILRPVRWFWLKPHVSIPDTQTSNWRTRSRRLD
jgi:undecaprenyl-diphosphatase